MTLEEALKTSIEFETKVRNLYRDASKQVTDPVGHKVFHVLANEEQGHLDFLNARFKEWKQKGKVSAQRVQSAIPPKDIIDENVRKLGKTLALEVKQAEIDLLSRALKLETETSAFYRRLVKELPEADRGLFDGFVAAEESHLAIVQAELDQVANNGVYFDFMEFKF